MLCRFCVLGITVTTLVSQNVLGLVEDVYNVYFATSVVKKGGLVLKATPAELNVRFKLFPLASQNFVLYITSLVTGLYYGYIFGQLAAREIVAADPTVRYNPWTPVSAYLVFVLPVSAAVGFVAVLLATSIPYFISWTATPKKAEASGPVLPTNKDIASSSSNAIGVAQTANQRRAPEGAANRPA
jgi:hypothetical protein